MEADTRAGDSLDTYRAKRDFALTPEPSGQAAGEDGEETGARRFVVQRHRARRTHYDFRLEVDGVLASWAMPKGPTLDPSVRSLAVHVEDHPIEYRDFEGVIPAGQYGGGDVIVWDRGTWVPAGTDDPAVAIAGGEIHFDLYGDKLRGRFALVRTRRPAGQEQWLMIHKHDPDAVDGWNPDDHPSSVKSGRTNDEVAAAPDALWRSDLPAAEAEVTIAAPADTAVDTGWDAPTEDELAALDALGDKGTWTLQGRDLQLTNLNKVLFPGRDGGAPVSKRELIRYYSLVGPAMLPFLEGRPVNMHRFPNGSDRPGFWHKQVPSHAPDWITQFRYEDAGAGDSERYFVIDSVPALAWMANYGAVELHGWTSRVPNVRQPTWALIDIDPGAKTTVDDVLLIALLFRDGLAHLGVKARPKTSGQRGLHIWVPVVPGYTFSQTSAWVEKLSKAVGAIVPELVSWTWQKNDRRGLARLDYTQNAINKTLVAPYSVRAADGAPVSTPVTWEELDDPGFRSDGWTVRDIPARLEVAGDPWAGLTRDAQRLPEL